MLEKRENQSRQYKAYDRSFKLYDSEVKWMIEQSQYINSEDDTSYPSPLAGYLEEARYSKAFITIGDIIDIIEEKDIDGIELEIIDALIKEIF